MVVNLTIYSGARFSYCLTVQMGHEKELFIKEQAKIDSYVEADFGWNRIAQKYSRAPKPIGNYIRDKHGYGQKLRQCRPWKFLIRNI